MIVIKDKTKCCGCTACANICPNHCIDMKPDVEGFLYPVVDISNCTNCNLCEKSCPVMNKSDSSKYIRSSYALRTKNHDILMESTSGGFFTPLAEWILKNNGIICAATFDEKYKVIHAIIYNREEKSYEKCKGSKYVQSYLGDCFNKIKNILDEGKMVCFVGTTCQVNGLKVYLVKEYEKLITVDLVCHGVTSPKLWEKYLNYQIEKYHSGIKNICFRNKTYGYHSCTMKIEFDTGKKYFGSARVDYMLKSFFREIASRPICYSCPFKDVNRCSDFTIYDCWHITELVQGLKDDDKGYTNIIVHSYKGNLVLDKIKDAYELYPVDTAKAIKLDGIMVESSAKPHPKRSNYYIEIDKTQLPEHIKKYISISRKDHIIEASKSLLFKLGLIQKIKHIRNRKK